MAQKVDLDAMIPREDFAVSEEPYVMDLIRDFPITSLFNNSPILRLLRKPDFQRETNHWTPEQLVTFVSSFLDSEVIPSLILWKAERYIFVIDGGHRLSALRAWVEDDYGDGAISLAFYNGDISEAQRKTAKRTRSLIEQKIGRFSTLKTQVDLQTAPEVVRRRAQVLFTRALSLQWIQGNASVAETSFFKINSQGTPLDETEGMLIRSRKKPIAIGARAIVRAGTGHKYWSNFNEQYVTEVEQLTAEFHEKIFKPESAAPLKTLDLPLGGSVSPVDALALLVEFLAIAGTRVAEESSVDKYPDDESGEATVRVLKNSFQVLNRISGTSPGSLGLHPAVYFYNERGKYSRFLFLGMVSLIQGKIRENDKNFFFQFTNAREYLEEFLIEHKSLLGIILQNLGRSARISKMRDLFSFLVHHFQEASALRVEEAIAHLGLRGRIVDVNSITTSTAISDDTKSIIYVRQAIRTSLRCPICHGLLDPAKSVHYDHIIPIKDGGLGDRENTQMVHPFCNTGYKERGPTRMERLS